jgi:hypothetical protein
MTDLVGAKRGAATTTRHLVLLGMQNMTMGPLFGSHTEDPQFSDEGQPRDADQYCFWQAA